MRALLRAELAGPWLLVGDMTAVDDLAARILPTLERWWNPRNVFLDERLGRLARDIARDLIRTEAKENDGL